MAHTYWRTRDDIELRWQRRNNLTPQTHVSCGIAVIIAIFASILLVIAVLKD